jgi:hypothetical protein
MVCPRNMKKTILKEMLKLKKEIELKRKSGWEIGKRSGRWELIIKLKRKFKKDCPKQ